MVELVDTPDLGSGAARCAGSSPVMGTKLEGCQSGRMDLPGKQVVWETGLVSSNLTPSAMEE